MTPCLHGRALVVHVVALDKIGLRDAQLALVPLIVVTAPSLVCARAWGPPAVPAQRDGVVPRLCIA